MEKRAFRTRESIDTEEATRKMLPAFLRRQGFSDIQESGLAQSKSQTIIATAPSGESRKIRVKLCWRSGSSNKRSYSAAQITAKVKNGDWEGTVRAYADRASRHGITHILFVKRHYQEIDLAALVPVAGLLPIWISQRDTSAAIISAGRLGHRRKNHAQNGSSPTIWLEDEKAPEVSDALWHYPGVISLPTSTHGLVNAMPAAMDDTFDDLPSLDDPLALGQDEAPRYSTLRSNVRRDPRVRQSVLIRAAGKCERGACELARSYTGFLDVHHILGVEKSDRIWNCVAICPNCHRDAHMSPDREKINEALLEFAKRSIK